MVYLPNAPLITTIKKHEVGTRSGGGGKRMNMSHHTDHIGCFPTFASAKKKKKKWK